MKKTIKKIISSIVPKSSLKEKLKLIFYNGISPKSTSFKLIKNNNKLVYKTTFENRSLFTAEALYFIAPDFNYYQHLYKVKPGDIIIDAGANCGHLSVYFSKIIGKEGRCYAFEPDSLNIERIKINLSLNTDLDDNISIQELLLWNENTTVDFYEAGSVGSSAIWIPDNNLCVKKEAVTIDSWVKQNKIGKLDFIKMDIEGAEIEALEGCVETIKTLAPNFAIASYHIVNNEATYIKLEAFFKKLNYPYQTVKFRGNEIITFAGHQ